MNLHNNAPSPDQATPPPVETPSAQERLKLPYEPPSLVPVGNLRDVLGKSGANPDYDNRRPHATKP
jgi:hypothetical protein